MYVCSKKLHNSSTKTSQYSIHMHRAATREYFKLCERWWRMCGTWPPMKAVKVEMHVVKTSEALDSPLQQLKMDGYTQSTFPFIHLYTLQNIRSRWEFGRVGLCGCLSCVGENVWIGCGFTRSSKWPTPTPMIIKVKLAHSLWRRGIRKSCLCGYNNG